MSALKNAIVVVSICVSTACSLSNGDEPAAQADGQTALDTNAQIDAQADAQTDVQAGLNTSFADPIQSGQTASSQGVSNTQNPVASGAPVQENTSVVEALQGSELALRLFNDFSQQNQQLVPINGWICEDVFEEKRIYYFYPAGVLDTGRSVAIERTLIASDMFNDVQFFWSVNGADSILLTSATVSEQGAVLSTGLQYDMNSIVFTDVDSVSSFTAESVLRGKLVCANFDLQ